MKSKSFFTTLRHPYYIYTFDYRQSSAGIRVLHYLCHALNLIGEEAYVNCEVTNTKLRTLKLTDKIRAKHCNLGLQPIAVYPEVVHGNPINAPVVARYILNKPGYLGGDNCYDPNELLFIYDSIFLPKDMEARSLFIPTVDPKIFNNLDNEFDKNRHGICFYANKFLSKGGKLTDLVKAATDLTLRIPRSPEEIAAILRRSEVLYCYEESAISTEALLCGCPVFYVPSDGFKPSSEHLGDDGIVMSLDPSDLERARSTVGNFTHRYYELEEQAWRQIENFVEITQTAAETRHQEAKLLFASTSINVRDLHTLADLSPTPTETASQPLLSIIICSIDDERFVKVARNYRDLLAVIPHEIIRINDAKSLCEGYNRGITRSKGEYLIFSHDDIEIWTPDFGQRLLKHLGCCDVVGVAGTDLLVDANTSTKVNWIWGGAGPAHVFGRIIQLDLDDGPGYYKYTVNLYGIPSLLVEGMQALDGVFIAMHRSVAVTLGFDEENFDGFHLYDIDFTYRAFHQGFRIGVFNDIAIIHYSSGRYDEHQWNFNQRFLNKFAGIIPKRQTLYWKTAKIGFQQIDEVLAFYEDSIQGLPQTAHVIATVLDEKNRDKSESSDTVTYQRWCEQRQLGEGWAELVGIRMMTRWRAQPTFHLVIWCEPGQQAALADTLESLGQQLYGQWGLSILAPFAAPDEMVSELPNIEWIRVDANADTALRDTLEASALDWFALIEPGDRLPTHALLTAADYINRHPAWRFIYLDEDQVDGRGERRDPLFRPDFDLDLLLATHYLGDFCLIQRESVLTSGDLPYVPGLLTFQAALHIREHYGRSAIGHIADVLYHRAVHIPVANVEVVAQARRQLVINYLNRRDIAATVEDALLPGTWRVVYRHLCRPKVSIIILARDAMDWLDRCLRRLFGKTAYPDYEILIVDCGSEVDDTIDLYSELEAGHPDQFQVIAAQGPFSISAYRNQGARQARGEVFIFLTGSALTIQAEWVDRLLNHALRGDVGIVGARLTTPDKTLPFIQGTAQVLGMRGIAGPLFTGLPLRAPGPLGRAQVDQTVSAVSAECMAIRREVFEAVNGFDEAFVIAHADIDLCLRTAMQGYRTMWTPFANLAWLGDYPLATGYSSVELTQLARADAERMFERWLPQLAADPAYNPNLSLAEPRRVEAELTLRWDTTFHDRPRLLGFPMDMSGCALYRVYAPLWLLEHQAKAECTLLKAGGRLPELAELARLAPDTVFYQSTLKDAWLEAMRQYRQFHRSFKVFDLDDLKHDVPDANSLKERLMRDIKYRHRQALQHCDRLIVSTEPLAEACRSWIPDIRVVPNRLERSRWAHLHNQRRAGSKPRVGWAGAQQHHGDLAFITEAVQQTHDEVDWIFFGMCLDDLRPYVKEVHDWVSLDDYPAKLASLNLDVAVAPLENHPFNEAKSNLRILEHGVLGRPMVCTDIYPYQNAPVVRVPNKTRAWVEAIHAYAHDLDAAERDGEALRTWVLDNYILDDHTDDWLSALRP